MANLPEINNYYAFVKNYSVIEVFQLLVGNGWKGRKSARDNCFFRNGLSELELYRSEGGLLLNGRLVNAIETYKELVKLFLGNGYLFLSELYDDNSNLLISDNFKDK